MKVLLITYALVWTVTVIAAMVGTDAGLISLNITLIANATEVLASHSIWTPDLTAFADSKYNLDGVNFTAEGEKLTKAGLDVNDLILVGFGDGDKHKCDHCKLCLKACGAALLLWFLWVDSPSLLPPPSC